MVSTNLLFLRISLHVLAGAVEWSDEISRCFHVIVDKLSNQCDSQFYQRINNSGHKDVPHTVKLLHNEKLMNHLENIEIKIVVKYSKNNQNLQEEIKMTPMLNDPPPPLLIISDIDTRPLSRDAALR